MSVYAMDEKQEQDMMRGSEVMLGQTVLGVADVYNLVAMRIDEGGIRDVECSRRHKRVAEGFVVVLKLV